MNKSLITHSPVGPLKLTYTTNLLLRIDFDNNKLSLSTKIDDFAMIVIDELKNYFMDPFFQFSIPFELSGTLWQQKVWRYFTTIPVGETLTYGQIAKDLSSHSRAIGQACRSNPIPIIIPCHRIVAINGMGGFNGAIQGESLQKKIWLLNHEKTTKSQHTLEIN